MENKKKELSPEAKRIRTESYYRTQGQLANPNWEALQFAVGCFAFGVVVDAYPYYAPWLKDKV